MSVDIDDDQCAAYVTEFESDAVEIALSVVQGIVTNLLLTVSHVADTSSASEQVPLYFLASHL